MQLNLRAHAEVSHIVLEKKKFLNKKKFIKTEPQT